MRFFFLKIKEKIQNKIECSTKIFNFFTKFFISGLFFSFLTNRLVSGIFWQNKDIKEENQEKELIQNDHNEHHDARNGPR